MSNLESNYFGITKEEINQMLEIYFSKKLDEDIENVKSLGGTEALIKKLKSNKSEGLDGLDEYNDSDSRKNEFDENHRKDEEMPHFCSFVWEALQD